MASKKKAGKAAAKKAAAKKGACAKQPPSISDEEALRRFLACGFNGSPGTAAMLLRLDALADIAQSFGRAEKLARSRAGGCLPPAAQVSINPVSRDARGKVSPTGEVEGLAIDACRPRRAYGDAFRALESRRLCRCTWLKNADVLMPSSAAAPAGAVSEIGELRAMATDLAERLRAREAAPKANKPKAAPAPTKPKRRSGAEKASPQPASKTAARGPAKAAKAPAPDGKAIEGAKALDEYSRSAADVRLGRWAAGAAAALRDGTADDELSREARAVACMWRAIAFESDKLCEFVDTAPLDVGTWLRMRDVYRDPASSDLDLGLASFYLNRTSVSGVLGCGIIGGLRQEGAYKMDARFARPGLIEKIRAIGKARDRIEVSELDAKEFLARRAGQGFAFLDPPYVKKGPSLYRSAFDVRGHEELAAFLAGFGGNWAVTYDDVELVDKLYACFDNRRLDISYTANVKRAGKEKMILSPGLRWPETAPSRCRR